MAEDLLAASGPLAGFLVGQQEAVLVGQEESGATAFTRIRGEYSCAMCTASHCVKLLTAALAAGRRGCG